jgi:hypothetical protein
LTAIRKKNKDLELGLSHHGPGTNPMRGSQESAAVGMVEKGDDAGGI